MNSPTRSKIIAFAALAFLSLALVLATFGAEQGRYEDDCANPELLTQPGFLHSDEPFRSVTDRLPVATTPLWLKGKINLQKSRTRPLDVVMIRSFDPIKLYLQPDNLEPLPADPEGGYLEWVDAGSATLPVHFVDVHTVPWEPAFAAYMYVYDSEPVRYPLLAQLGTAIPDLAAGTRPLTILIVQGSVLRLDLREAKERAGQWIADSWIRYRRACKG
jgi:hypothetical protein